VLALRSRMSMLDYTMEPEADCPDNDVNDVAFVRVMNMIGGRDAVEEFLACGMYPLLVGFSFRNVTTGMTAVSKVKMPLPIFPVEAVSTEDANCFLATVKTDAEKILGSYGPREHDVCMIAKLPNGGCLNRVFEQMGVPYAPHPLTGTEAFTTATKEVKSRCVEENCDEEGEGCPT
jgi:hypothetical protein